MVYGWLILIFSVASINQKIQSDFVSFLFFTFNLHGSVMSIYNLTDKN